jgi:tellurite methyltransferase
MQKNWITFYENKKAPLEPSSFAKFILDREIPGDTLIDLGSGNGRDTYALANRYKARGVDPATFPDRTDWACFARAPWQSMAEEIKQADIVYSRFFLHSITPEEVAEIIRLTPRYFIAEARHVGDNPAVYPEHERHYVDGQLLLDILADNGFVVHFYEMGRGLAPYKNEDPLLMRVIAKRKL